jgi:short-subunit dehydrogenase
MPLSRRYRSALVTGAGSGLGRAFASMLAGEGVRVWGTSRDPQRTPPVTGVTFLPLELARPESVETTWAAAEGASGGIDLLVNNAGAALFGGFCEQEAEAWERQVAILALGPARLARLALAAMRARGRGCIVNVSSLAVDFPIPFLSAYNAGKAALAALSASLELETAGGPVSCIDFRPGDHPTNFNQAMANASSRIERSPQATRAWARVEALMAAGPPPERAARDLGRALRRGRRGTVRSGTFLQAHLAPLLQRLLPAGLMRALHRRHYDLG